MNRRSFMKLSALSLAGLALPKISAADKKSDKPNILIVVADDATYRDLPLYGGQNVKTPHIDALAAQGMTFSKAYLTMSMCVPCRTELYTGLYPLNSGCCWNHSPARPGTKSICHHLGDLGYRVGLAGKLHVTPESVFPFDMVDGFERDCVAATADYDCAEIQKYMESNKEQPFCLVLGLVVPHVVWTAGDSSHFDPKQFKLPSNMVDTLQTRQDFASYLAEIEYLDKQIGDILDTLKISGCHENTIVIFTSEQGAQFAGCKWTNYDCGVHTGFVVRWPGHVKPASRTDAIIQYTDVLPTLVEIASGQRIAGFDGKSFLDVLLGKSISHRGYAYAMHNNVPDGPAYPIRSICDQRYRYIRNLLWQRTYLNNWIMVVDHTHYWDSWMLAAEKNEDAYKIVNRFMNRPAEELYDLQNDPYELNNLADLQDHAQIKKRLSAELDRWMKSNNDPGAELDSLEKVNAARKNAASAQK